MPSSPSTSRWVSLALVPVLTVALHAMPAAGIETPSAASASDAQRLTFLLQYIGTDYDRAVREGTVVNDSEYGEVLRFVRQLIHDYGARPRRAREVMDGLARLEQRMIARAPADEVWGLTRQLLPKLRTSIGGAACPERVPDLASGRQLWMHDCAICHGESAGGDGSASSGMEPLPTAFRGEYLERLAPQQVFDAVSVGVEGTAMPSFASAYDDAQRWDVAFFAMTLRVGFEPKRPSVAKHVGLAELADSSDAELLARLRRTEPRASAENVDWLRVNLVSAEGQVAPLADAGVANTGGLALALQMQDAFASVADRIFPRVVGVASYVRDPSWTDQRLRAEHGDGWMNANADALRYAGFRRIRTGSGLLVDDEGYVLTDDHLVRDDDRALAPLVEVELHDQTRIVCAVIGAEPMLDLAVLRIADTTLPALPALELGDSNRLETGHWLIALGDPPGPEQTFTVGLVATPPRRQCYQAELSATRVQSSLVVAPRGLGGPVVDIVGHVVGVSVLQETTTGEPPVAGILPINLVANLFEALKVARSNRSPWIGISVLELPAAQRLLESRVPAVAIPASGVYIDDVFHPSPAHEAGIRPGDFLVGLGGHRVQSVGDFQTWLYVAGIDTKVELELMRDGRTLTIPVTVEERPASASTH